MTPLNFSFESEQYLFSVCSYTRSHPHFVLEVTALTSIREDRKHQFLILSMPMYFSGRMSWQGGQPYIAPHTTLIEYVSVHPGVPKEVLEFWDIVRNLPDETADDQKFITDTERSLSKLYVFPCAAESVHIIASYYSLHDNDPRG